MIFEKKSDRDNLEYDECERTGGFVVKTRRNKLDPYIKILADQGIEYTSVKELDTFFMFVLKYNHRINLLIQAGDSCSEGFMRSLNKQVTLNYIIKNLQQEYRRLNLMGIEQ